MYREGLQRLKAALVNTHLKTRLEGKSVLEILELLWNQFSASNETYVFCLDTEEKLSGLSVGAEYADVNALYREFDEQTRNIRSMKVMAMAAPLSVTQQEAVDDDARCMAVVRFLRCQESAQLTNRGLRIF